MDCTELSPVGNFEAWEPQRIKELNTGKFTSEAGQQLLHEGSDTRLWLVRLEHKQRLGFRQVESRIKVLTHSDGFAVSHYGNGQICLIEFKKDVIQRQELVGCYDTIWDLENIGMEPLEFILIEYLSEMQLENY